MSRVEENSVLRFHFTWAGRGPHCRPVHGFLDWAEGSTFYQGQLCLEISSYLGGQGPHCRPVHGFQFTNFVLPGRAGVLTAGLFMVAWFGLRVTHSIKDYSVLRFHLAYSCGDFCA